MPQYSNKTWVCPFYQWSKKEDIYCEGGVLKFPDWQAMSDYADKYCASFGYEGCGIAQALTEFYEREHKK